MSLRCPSKYTCTNGVVVYPDGTEVCNLKTAAGRKEYSLRREAMAERQGWQCAICRYVMSCPEFDHQAGRGMNSSKRDDRLLIDGELNNAALCSTCNRVKSSRPYQWVNGEYKEIA